MKYSDIQKIHAAGLISDEQHRAIIEHFDLKEESGKFLTIISFVGAALVVCGIVLLMAANWEDIPRGVKIAMGLLLMLGAHGGGWYLREVRQKYRKSGAALHLVGSCLFLGNIALIGQIYHLSSRPPNAFLLWWAGIAALPWLLRSKAQHVLSLLAFGVWFGFEINEPGSWIYFGHDEYQIVPAALLGMIYLGLGYCLRRTAFADFAPVTGKLGLLLFLTFAYPLTWRIFHYYRNQLPEVSVWVFPTLSVLALILIALGLRKESNLTRQWRWTWGLALAGGIALLAAAMWLPDRQHWDTFDYYNKREWLSWLASIVLFVFCLLQIHVGIQDRSPFVVNLGVTFIALNIITIYLRLFGSMGLTGLMFLISGVFLIAFGIYLEKKRRALIRRIKTPALERS